jgi:1-deoxy-D-xylulose-5-phosphate reductoisomerase
MIEAKWMFGLKNEQIDVVVHPQSIVHSFVEFIDGSQKAQMGLPDMKLPIQYALAYPKRLANNYPRYINHKHTKLTFEEADLKTFRNLGIAIEAMKQGGNVPCIMNAANEIAVAAFLKNKIGFLEMSDLIEKSIEKIDFIATPSLHDYKETDRQTRQFCQRLIKD